MSPGLGASWEDELYDPPPGPPQPTVTPPRPVSPPAAGRTSKLTVQLDAELLERGRNAVWHLSGPPEHLTVTDLVARAVRAEIERLEREHNQGEPFPPRQREVRRGRPLRSTTDR